MTDHPGTYAARIKAMGALIAAEIDRLKVVSSHPPLHTVAQLARRIGISEGRARALLAAQRLPVSDYVDVDGHPLWFESTIDVWCRMTGRTPPNGSLDVPREPLEVGIDLDPLKARSIPPQPRQKAL